jgi:NitT/TauT family transport system substrate-binding protein
MKKIFLLICSVVLLAACTSKPTGSLTIGVLKGPSAISVAQWLQQSPVIAGKKVKIVVCDEVSDLQALMIQKKVDFALLPTTMAAILYNKGVDYRMVACPVQGSIYVVSSDSISSFDDLKNRKIGISGQGTTPDVLFELLAKRHGFTLQEQHLDFSIGTHADLAQAVVLGKIKTALLPEPFVTLVCTKNPKVKPVVNLAGELAKSDSSTLFALTAFVVCKSMVEQQKTVVDSVAKRYQVAIEWLYAHPERTAQAVVDAKVLPNVQVALRSIPRCGIRYISASAASVRIADYLRIFLNFDPKTVGGRLPDSNFYYFTQDVK